MSILDTTIVNVALETLRIDLGAPLSTIQWVSTGYLLALATAIPLTGWAAERFGPRRVWMTAVAAFVVTSGLCGLAWSAESLIGFRVLQGFAGGMIMPIGMITLAQAAGPDPHGPRDEHRRGADAAGPGARSRDRRRDRPEPVLALDLPREPAGGDRRAPAGAPAACPPAARPGAPRRTGTRRPSWTGVGSRSCRPGVGAIVFGISEYGAHRTFATPSAWLPLVLGLRRRRRLRRPRLARALSAARRPPVPLGRLLGRRGHGLPHRDRAVRLDDPAAALLPDRPRRIAADRRPARGPAGSRRRRSG